MIITTLMLNFCIPLILFNMSDKFAWLLSIFFLSWGTCKVGRVLVRPSAKANVVDQVLLDVIHVLPDLCLEPLHNAAYYEY